MNKELTNELIMFEADHVWVNENLETLLKPYTDLCIGVTTSKIVASHPDVAALASKLSHPAHTCVDFIPSEPLEMVL